MFGQFWPTIIRLDPRNKWNTIFNFGYRKTRPSTARLVSEGINLLRPLRFHVQLGCALRVVKSPADSVVLHRSTRPVKLDLAKGQVHLCALISWMQKKHVKTRCPPKHGQWSWKKLSVEAKLIIILHNSRFPLWWRCPTFSNAPGQRYRALCRSCMRRHQHQHILRLGGTGTSPSTHNQTSMKFANGIAKKKSILRYTYISGSVL